MNTAKIIAENPNETLDRQIDETRRFIRQIDFSLSFFSLLTMLLAVLFAAILADHWLFTDGLSISLRLGVFGILVFIIVFYVYRRIVPLLLYPINPVYAASLLEESSPSLKNSIVNWILLRKERLEQEECNRDKLSERIFDGVTQTAVSKVTVISSERAVDLRNVTRWGIALTLCFLFFVIYATFSPKSPLTSLTRIILPISKIEKPQAVRFLNVEPGNTVALQGEKLTISAEVVSRNKEPVYLFFSTDDGQAVRQAIPMSLPEGKTRYEVPFPPGKQGFASGVDYWIAQNDSRSGTFRIKVRPTAAIEIVSLRYRFPPYTGLPEKIVENTGDIRAVEGTEVKIGVRSTIPLQRIDLVFDNDPLRTVGMKIADENPTEAAATITLKLDPQRNTPTTIRNFSFRATDQEGYENRRSGVFRLEVLPDQPPMVQWADTDTRLKEVAQLDLPLNNSLELPIQAEDRDFGLRYLRFRVESGNKQIRPVELLESPATGATEHKGSIQRKAIFSPITSRLAEGDTAEIWAEAVDTKFPDPNNATTRRITVQIVAPQKQEQPPKEKSEQEKKEQQNNTQQNKEEQNSNEQNKEQQANKRQKPENNRENRENNGENEEQQKSDHSRNDQNRTEQTQESTQQENSNTSESPNADENSVGNNNNNNNQNDSNQNNPDKEHSEQKNNDSLKNNSYNNNSSDNGKQGEQNGKENSNQSVRKKQGDSSQKSDRQSNVSKKPINPETQDGDAIEEILKQMKKEGKFDDKKLNDNNNNSDKNDNQNNNNQNRNQNNNEQNREQQNNEQRNDNEQNQNQSQNQKGEENRTDSKPANSTPDSQSEQQQQQNEQDSEKQDTGKQGSEKQGSEKQDVEKQRSEKQGESDSQQNTSQPNHSNQTDTKNSEPTNGGNGGNQQSDSVSESSGNQGNNSKSEQQRRDVPVDPADKTPRQRDDSLDPNSTERSNQGGDSNKPKKSDVDRANDSVTDGNDGNGRETRQQERSNQTQSTEQGMSGNKSDNKNGNRVEKQNSTTKNAQSVGDQQETKQSNESDSGESGNSDQDKSNRSGLLEGKNSAAGTKPSDKPLQNSASENSANDKNNAKDKNSTNNQNNAENDIKNGTENNIGRNMKKSTENNQSQPSSLGTENNPSSSVGSDAQSNSVGGQGPSALNVETPTEDANLEYSKKITNLVLDYLEDQLKSKPSQELLDNLGWSEQELRDFHHKWSEMSEQSKRSESTATNDDARWKEAFKSLGLRPAQNRQQLQKSRTGIQDENKVIESQRFTPPPAIKDRFTRYTEGIGK
jgi:hypothetical protein